MKEAPDRNMFTLQCQRRARRYKSHTGMLVCPLMRRIWPRSSRYIQLWGQSTRRCSFGVLREYRDIFAWEPKDMPGVDLGVAVHRLYMDPH
ncbi:hypothetical protein LIER_20550 [Lithospermum erythrorhizon]|uniref:Uncharacterized protein n=1 Tax=Lithospermum erythrorhizon TaxID=34254 RepID=A0AAV3QQB3_LITER